MLQVGTLPLDFLQGEVSLIPGRGTGKKLCNASRHALGPNPSPLQCISADFPREEKSLPVIIRFYYRS